MQPQKIDFSECVFAGEGYMPVIIKIVTPLEQNYYTERQQNTNNGYSYKLWGSYIYLLITYISFSGTLPMNGRSSLSKLLIVV